MEYLVMKQTSIIFAVVIMGIIVIGGCVQQIPVSPPVPSPQQTPATVVPTGTPVTQTTTVTAPVPAYKTADLEAGYGATPAHRFTMDYPSSWTYGKVRLS